MCAVLAFAAGCATGSKGPTDQELINQTLNNWKVGMESKDITKLEIAISDKFNHFEWGNKEQMLSVLKNFFSTGDLDNAKIVLDSAKTTIDGSKATVYPVELTASFGSATIEFTLEKEADGQWRATSVNVEGV
jgi:hypothetical protein